MNPPFEMDYFLAFGYIGICIFIGVCVRALFKPLQHFLVPACMIGGLLGMAVMNTGFIPLDTDLFRTLAYHFFIISFISIGLTQSTQQSEEAGKGKSIARGAFWMGMINAASMVSQAFIACVLVLIFGLVGLKIPLSRWAEAATTLNAV